MIHLDRPVHLDPPPITQAYANQFYLEPLGFKFPDNSIGYVNDGTGMLGHWHNGIDYGVQCGTPLFAPADGKVVLAGVSETGFGLRLTIDHGPVWTLYGHLSDITFKLGQTVRRGQLIGHSGGGNHDWRDGNSNGCHLHWSVADPSFSRYLDPVPFVFGSK